MRSNIKFAPRELLPSRLRRATSLKEGGFILTLPQHIPKGSLFEEAVSEADGRSYTRAATRLPISVQPTFVQPSEKMSPVR